jgi:hypothetical protein
MAQMTVLDMVQNILASLDSDEVNSIGDTVESRQVAQILQNKYYDMTSRGQLPEHTQLLQLTPSVDPDRPVLMFIPEQVSRVEWIKYFDSNVLDGQSDQSAQFGSFSHDLNLDLTAGTSIATAPPGYIYVTILPVDQFLDYTNRFNPEESDVFSFKFNEGAFNFTFYYKNDHRPQYCCVLENTYVIFDMFDATQDSTLQASKTMCLGQIVPDFVLSDTFIPDIDPQQFPLLINEAKAWAWIELKQMPHPKAEQEVKRQWSTVQKNKSYVNKPSYFDQLSDFGRVPRTGGFSGGGYGAYKWMRQSSP